MEIKVVVELGPKTLAILTGGTNLTVVGAKEVKAPTKAKTVEEEAEAAPASTAEKKKATRRRAAAKAKTVDFAELDEDAQLDAIKAEVTKHTKKGKSADIKALLVGFDAGRASELVAEDYADFMDAVKRYGAGESVDDILALD